MLIRRAKNSDAEDILELLKQVQNIHAEIRPDIFKHGATKYNKNQVLSIIKNSQTPIFVCEQNDRVVGYAFCIVENVLETENIKAEKVLYLDDLCVDKTLRGVGIGKKLYEFVKESAKTLGCGKITLNVWEGNESAKSFYRNLGLTPLKTVMEQKI